MPAYAQQKKSRRVTVRMTDDEKRLLEFLAERRVQTVSALLRDHGIDEAVQLARIARTRNGDTDTGDAQ